MVNIRLRVIHITLAIILTSFTTLYAQYDYTIASDTTVSVVERNISQQKIDQYRALSAYDYQEDPEYETNILSSLWKSFKQALKRALGDTGFNIVSKVFFYGLIFLGIAMLVLTLAKSQGYNPFARTRIKSDNELAAELIDENTDVESIDKLINKAEEANEYRLAIRLYYLKSLRILTDVELIQWKAGKTNHEYLLEIDNPDIKEQFDKLSYIYEYSWYGHFEIEDESQYQEFKQPFVEFINNVSN